jgi:hypothetical protein
MSTAGTRTPRTGHRTPVRVFTPDPGPVAPVPCPQHGAHKWYACCPRCYDFHMPHNLTGREEPAGVDG